MELTPLRYFIAIAAAGHMTRAARLLGVTQPALSAMLRKLETQVGAELLFRTGRGVQVTEAGQAFLSHAQDAVRQADAAVRAAREVIGLERGSIRIGGGATAVTYLLPPVVAAFRPRDGRLSRRLAILHPRDRAAGPGAAAFAEALVGSIGAGGPARGPLRRRA